MNWIQRARSRQLLRIHHDFEVASLELFHGALEDDPPTIDEDKIGQDIFDLIDLMRGNDDGARPIEVIVEKRIVELLPIKDVETECRLIQD